MIKHRYKFFFLPIIIFATAAWVFFVGFTSFGDNLRLEKIIQGVGVFIALFAAIIALAVADVKKEIIKIEIKDTCIKNLDQEITQDIISNYKFESISDISESKIKERYKNFEKPIKFFIVEFEIINKSNFSWKNPNFTYEIPISQRYLIFNKQEKIIREDLPHTNYHKKSPLEKNYYFLSGNKDIFTLTNLPYINNEKSLTIWFTLFLDPSMEEFTINMSINCENAEGVTKEIRINPKELIDDFKKKTD